MDNDTLVTDTTVEEGGMDVHLPPRACARTRRVDQEFTAYDSRTDFSSIQGKEHSSTGASRTAHVPSPPNSNLMETEAFTDSRTDPVQGGSSLTAKEYDPVDVLFEMENQNEVADEGHPFGFSDRVPRAGMGRGVKGRSGTVRTERERPNKTSSLQEDDFFADDFPYKGKCVYYSSHLMLPRLNDV